MKKFLFATTISLWISATTAQIGGEHAYRFLNLAPSARVAGQAGFVLANTYSDANYGFYNPALLNENMHGMLSMNVGMLPAGMRMGEAVYVHHHEKAGTFSAGFKYLNYGDFQQTNQQAQVLGNFTAADQALQLGYAYKLDTNWSFGANLKIINSAFEIYSSWAIATDLAAVYQIPERRLAVAFMARNIGTQLVYYNDVPESLPFELQMAISNKFEHMPLRWSLIFNNLQRWDLSYDGDPTRITRDPITGEFTVDDPDFLNLLMRHVAVAAEFIPTEGFNAQIGYDWRRRYEMAMTTRRSSAGLTFGVGVKVSKFRLNYANTNMHPSARMHHISITTALDKFKKKAKTPDDI
ncbi:MAG: type IX secretion system protein PorQ [Schleiferiaceae bacterium]|nr:type IX secretion system protein PorQ [Schleiferiaceae bacterium]